MVCLWKTYVQSLAVACGGLWHEWRNTLEHKNNTLLYVFLFYSLYLQKFYWTAFDSSFFRNQAIFFLSHCFFVNTFFCHVVRLKKAMTFGLSYYTFKNTSWIDFYKHTTAIRSKQNPLKQMNFLLIM